MRFCDIADLLEKLLHETYGNVRYEARQTSQYTLALLSRITGLLFRETQGPDIDEGDRQEKTEVDGGDGIWGIAVSHLKGVTSLSDDEDGDGIWGLKNHEL